MKKIFTLSLASLALVSAAALTGCASDKDTDAKAMTVNSACPYTGSPVNPDITSEFRSQSVGFCCNGCKTRFDKDTDAGKAARVASAAPRTPVK